MHAACKLISKVPAIKAIVGACIMSFTTLVPSNWSLAQAPGVAGPPLQYVFISDLHIGVGRDDRLGGWHPFEDFRWEDTFGQFLRYLRSVPNQSVHLVLVGDILELWQSPFAICTNDGNFVRCRTPDCVPSPKLGCSEVEAWNRIDRALQQHKKVFSDLKDFVSDDRNRIVIIPGNHDAALLFPSVRDRLLQELGTKNIDFQEQGYWQSAKRTKENTAQTIIRAEHGHQWDLANKFDDWPKPFALDNEKVLRLQRPPGEHLVQDFYNSFEAQYPILDNITKEISAIDLVAKTTGSKGVAHGISEFVRLLIVQMSAGQALAFMGEKKAEDGSTISTSDWDLVKIKASRDSRLLVEVISERELRALAEVELRNNRFTLTLADLSDNELRALCTLRESMRRSGLLRDQNGNELTVSCPVIGGVQGELASRALGVDVLLAYLQELRSAEARSLRAQAGSDIFFRPAPTQTPFDIFIYGHTHIAEKPYEKNIFGWRLRIANTGAFHRVVSPSDLDTIIQSKGLKKEEALNVLRPEDLPACFSFVRVTTGSPKFDVDLRYWAMDDDGIWKDLSFCPWPKKR